MKGFTPFKRKPNQFKYTPRFYDPQKEERDLRRAELCGSRPESSEDGEYVAGEYLRRQREAREARRGRKSGSSRNLWFMIIGVVLVFLLVFMILPRLIGAFTTSVTTPEKSIQHSEYEEFDPYAPIRIVPNDYVGE